MLRKLLPVLALMAGMGTALADETPWGYPYDPMGDSGLGGYAGLRGSLAWSDDITATSGTNSTSAAQDMGYGGSFFMGKNIQISDLIGLRVEGEALFRISNARGLTVNGASIPHKGRTTLAAPMLNLYWDMPVPSFPVRPFIGGGIGAAWVNSEISSGGLNVLTSRTWNLAYQFMAGAMFPISQGSRLTAMYRMFRVDDVGMTCHSPVYAKCKSNLSSNSVDIGFEMDI